MTGNVLKEFFGFFGLELHGVKYQKNTAVQVPVGDDCSNGNMMGHSLSCGDPF
jgi:hypothetical protein